MHINFFVVAVVVVVFVVFVVVVIVAVVVVVIAVVDDIIRGVDQNPVREPFAWYTRRFLVSLSIGSMESG